MQLTIHETAHTYCHDPEKLLWRLVAGAVDIDYAEEDYFADESVCWPLEGAVSKSGYPLITVDGRRFRAHIAMYNVVKGPVPTGKNRRCINPTHLFAGSHQEYMAMSVGGHAADHPHGDVRVFTGAQVLGILAAFHQRICNIHGRARELHCNLHVVRPVAKDETHGA
jgi:hypothetical protein